MTRVSLLTILTLSFTALADEPIDIGSRRELMVDDYLIDSMSDSLRLQLHKPVRRNVALVTDAAWEGNACAYSSLFHDGSKFRMYYTANHYVNRDGRIEEPRGRRLCYAESMDGIHFSKPDLGLVEFAGSKKNNIVLAVDTVPGIRLDPGHTTILRDTNPDCPPDARYKAICRSSAKGEPGLFTLKSADGFHFSQFSDGLIITDGYFDSENLAFWIPSAVNTAPTFVTFVTFVTFATGRREAEDSAALRQRPRLTSSTGAPESGLNTRGLRTMLSIPIRSLRMHEHPTSSSVSRSVMSIVAGSIRPASCQGFRNGRRAPKHLRDTAAQ